MSGAAVIAAIEGGFRARGAQRLADLEVQAQTAAEKAAAALANGDRDRGVLLLVAALIATEHIDRLEGTRS